MRTLFLVGACIALFALAGCQSSTVQPTATTVPAEPTEISMPPSPTATIVPATRTPVPATTTAEPETGSSESSAADAHVEFVRAVQAEDGTWTFEVTVRHADIGWDDYADGWDVVAPDGTVLKADSDDEFTRVLLHPHENEQPFTRSQSGIEIPEGITELRVRAHDLVDGFGGQEVTVDLTMDEGENFEVVR